MIGSHLFETFQMPLGGDRLARILQSGNNSAKELS